MRHRDRRRRRQLLRTRSGRTTLRTRCLALGAWPRRTRLCPARFIAAATRFRGGRTKWGISVESRSLPDTWRPCLARTMRVHGRAHPRCGVRFAMLPVFHRV